MFHLAPNPPRAYRKYIMHFRKGQKLLNGAGIGDIGVIEANLVSYLRDADSVNPVSRFRTTYVKLLFFDNADNGHT